MRLAQVYRTSGVVVDDANEQMFKTKWTICSCVASAEGRIWTPIIPRRAAPALTRGATAASPCEASASRVSQRTTSSSIRRLLPGGVAALVSGAGFLWLGDSATDKVYRVNPRNSKVKPFALHQSADVLVFAEGSLWALDTLEGKITRVDPSTGRSLPSFPSRAISTVWP